MSTNGTITSDINRLADLDLQVDLVRRYLAERTIGCPACHYNLRGATGDACPECGVKLHLHLNTLNPRMGPWLVGVIAVAMALGFSFILGMTAAFGAWRAWKIGQNFSWYQPWSEFDSYTLATLAGISLFYAIALLFIVRRRSKFLAKSRWEQWLRSMTLTLTMAAMQVGLMYLWTHATTF